MPALAPNRGAVKSWEEPTKPLTLASALLAAALSGVCPAAALGQDATSTVGRGTHEHPSIAPSRVDAPPRIDGRLDDAVWASAAKIDTFVQERPVEAAPASESTEVFVAYDSQQIYIGIHAHYSDPSIVRANRADRDQIGRDDTVTVFFDPFLDQQRGYAFSVNGYGVQASMKIDPKTGQQLAAYNYACPGCAKT